MTKRWNNDENDEKGRKTKKCWRKKKHGKSSHMNQDILKRYDKVKRGQNDEKRTKRGQKDEKMMKWWHTT